MIVRCESAGVCRIDADLCGHKRPHQFNIEDYCGQGLCSKGGVINKDNLPGKCLQYVVLPEELFEI